MADHQKTALRFNLTQLGSRLRALRIQKGWTLADLAQRASLSEAYLSRIESGERQPSLAVLFDLALTYHMPMAALFEEESPGSSVVVRSKDATLYQSNGLSYRLLSNQGNSVNLRPVHVTIPADRQNQQLYHHEGEEWLYVLSGQLRLRLGEEEFILDPGDAAHFNTRIPHQLSALNEQDAKILLVTCETT